MNKILPLSQPDIGDLQGYPLRFDRIYPRVAIAIVLFALAYYYLPDRVWN